MVQDTGAAPSAGAIKPLNTPIAIKVKTDGWGEPSKVRLGSWLEVVAVQDRWRIDDEWWRDRPISRIYYMVVLRNGLQMTICRDLVAETWYRQSYG